MKRLHFLEMNKDEAQADDVEPVEQFPVMAVNSRIYSRI